MIIKNVNLETVCGITSPLPKNQLPEIAFAGKFQCREIFADQWIDEPEILCPDFRHPRQDPDDQFLQYQ